MTELLPEIDRTRLLDLASELVRIPSFVPNESDAAFYLRDFFTDRGYDVLMQEVESGRFQTIAPSLEPARGAVSCSTDISISTR